MIKGKSEVVTTAYKIEEIEISIEEIDGESILAVQAALQDGSDLPSFFSFN